MTALPDPTGLPDRVSSGRARVAIQSGTATQAAARATEVQQKHQDGNRNAGPEE